MAAFTNDELVLLVAVMATREPTTTDTEAVRALHHKARSITTVTRMEDGKVDTVVEDFTVVPDVTVSSR